MRVVFFPEGPFASMTSRLLPLARGLQRFGIDCEMVEPIRWQRTAKTISGPLSVMFAHSPADYARVLFDAPDAVMIGGLSTPHMYFLARALQRQGAKLIFDLSDALFIRTSKLFGVRIRPNSLALEQMLGSANHVTVNGHYLMNYAHRYARNVTLIHDPVDTRLFSPNSRHSKRLTLGWEGVPRNHYNNLRILLKPMIRLAKEFDFSFKIASYLGDKKVKVMFSDLQRTVEIDYGSEHYVSIGELSGQISQFDIMLAPLEKTPWYEGKSAGRIGFGMALGIPVIGSPVGEQKYLIREGVNGLLAGTEESWYRGLKALLEDPNLRFKIGQGGRATAESELAEKVCAEQLRQVLITA